MTFFIETLDICSTMLGLWILFKSSIFSGFLLRYSSRGRGGAASVLLGKPEVQVPQLAFVGT